MKNEVILITGQRGQGKTTYIKNQIDLFDRVILFDLLGEFTYHDTAFSVKEFFKKLSQYKNENFFILNFYNPKNSEEDFHIVCEAINRISSIMFVVDEIDYFVQTHSIPKEFNEIIKRGRHQSLQLMVATRRPFEIPPIIRSQVTSVITFRHLEPNDVKYLQDLCGFSPEEVQKLNPFEYLIWEEQKGILKGKVKSKKGEEEVNLKRLNTLYVSPLEKAEDSGSDSPLDDSFSDTDTDLFP